MDRSANFFRVCARDHVALCTLGTLGTGSTGAGKGRSGSSLNSVDRIHHNMFRYLRFAGADMVDDTESNTSMANGHTCTPATRTYHTYYDDTEDMADSFCSTAALSTLKQKLENSTCTLYFVLARFLLYATKKIETPLKVIVVVFELRFACSLSLRCHSERCAHAHRGSAPPRRHLHHHYHPPGRNLTRASAHSAPKPHSAQQPHSAKSRSCANVYDAHLRACLRARLRACLLLNSRPFNPISPQRQTASTQRHTQRHTLPHPPLPHLLRWIRTLLSSTSSSAFSELTNDSL